MTSRGPRLNVLLGALAIGMAGINEPRPSRREPIDPPPPPRPPVPPPPDSNPADLLHDRLPHPSRAVRVAKSVRFAKPRQLTRDELAAESKRQRKAAKAREDAARRVAGMVPESYAEDLACEQEMMADLYEETVRGLASSDYDYLNGGYKW